LSVLFIEATLITENHTAVYDGTTLVTEVPFGQFLICNGLNIAVKDAQWILYFQMTIDMINAGRKSLLVPA